MHTEIKKFLENETLNNPALIGRPSNTKTISSVEKFATFKLPDSYKEFLFRYGSAIVGAYSVYGTSAAKAMGDDESSVIEVTERYRKDGWFNEDWFDIKENVIVISSDFSGNPIILDKSGKIWLLDHDLGSKELIAEDFEDFLLNWCMKDID